MTTASKSLIDFSYVASPQYTPQSVAALRFISYGGGPFVYDVENIQKVLLSSYHADSWERYIGYT